MSFIDIVTADDLTQLQIVSSNLELVVRHGNETTPLSFHPRLRKLLEHLELHPSRRFSTTDAAKIVCFQKNYFCAFFKRETGYTFVSWQRNWRSARIAELLLSDNISITHAAERYGYPNIRSFERAFKEVYRVSAREFRREYRADPAVLKNKRRKTTRLPRAITR